MKKFTTTLAILTAFIFCLHIQSVAAGLAVVVSIPPQKWLCDKLGGIHVTTQVLVDKGQDPHTFEPTPRQIAALFKAKLYFTLDLEFEEQILQKISQAASQLVIVDTALPDSIEEGHEKTENEYHYDGKDPHIWLSPLYLKKMAVVMAEAMIQADTAHRRNYEHNLAVLLEKLDFLHVTIQERLAPYKGSSFYVFHPTFGHFARTYDLIQETVEVEGKAPRPRQLAALISKARKEKVRVIFVQPQYDTKSALAVAHAIQGEVVPLDALAEDVAFNLELMSIKIATALEQKRKE